MAGCAANTETAIFKSAIIEDNRCMEPDAIRERVDDAGGVAAG
jgi:hypothetical protein